MYDARIVDAARGWLGTRFHHQGRVKKTASHSGGVDCLGLLVGVARELDLRRADGTPLTAFDATDYSHYPDTIHLKQKLALLLTTIEAKDIAPGDVVLMKIDGLSQHLAIVSDGAESLGIIHAYAPSRAVVEHALDGWWRMRIDSAFRI